MNKYYVQLLENRNQIYVYADKVIEFEDKYLLIRDNDVIAMILRDNVDFMHLDND